MRVASTVAPATSPRWRKGGRVPERAHGKYLLSAAGCSSARSAAATSRRGSRRGKGSANVYICGTRRRKPGVCTNTLALPIAETDDDVLGIVEGEVLGTRFIDELLALVDATPDHDGAAPGGTGPARAARSSNLVRARRIGRARPRPSRRSIRERQTEIARLDVAAARARPSAAEHRQAPRGAEQRAAQWKADLRAEPKVARLLLRRLVGPLTLWDEPDAGRALGCAASRQPACWTASSNMVRPQRDSNPRFRRERPTS